MPMASILLRDSAAFERWAHKKQRDTGDSLDTWQHWFGSDVPKSYPVMVVYFWMERAGLIVDFWVEYIYPSHFQNDVLNNPRRGDLETALPFKAGDRVVAIHTTKRWNPGLGTVLKVSEKRVTVCWDQWPGSKKTHYHPKHLAKGTA